ncbi:MAG: NAD-dependent epimerase/dehydratase family protein [Piscinibacter sp.]
MTATTLAPARRCVLILGANGRFGAAAAKAFAEAGWRVLAQVRRVPPAAIAGVETLAVPLTDTDALLAAAAGASVVVHAVNPLYTRWDAEAMPLLEAGLAVATRLHAHFLLPGNVYNHGEQMPPLLREDTPQRPTTRKGEIRVAMEAAIAAACARGEISATVIRAGDFFGTGTGSWLDLAIARSLREGKLVYPGPMGLAHAWAYLPDLASAFVAVASQGGSGFRTLHFGGHTATGTEFLAALEQAAGELGLAPAGGFRRGGMPWGLIRAVGIVHPLWRELARMSYLWRVPHALDGQRLATLPGVHHTPLPQALRQSLLDLGFAAANRAIVPA